MGRVSPWYSIAGSPGVVFLTRPAKPILLEIRSGPRDLLTCRSARVPGEARTVVALLPQRPNGDLDFCLHYTMGGGHFAAPLHRVLSVTFLSEIKDTSQGWSTSTHSGSQGWRRRVYATRHSPAHSYRPNRQKRWQRVSYAKHTSMFVPPEQDCSEEDPVPTLMDPTGSLQYWVPTGLFRGFCSYNTFDLHDGSLNAGTRIVARLQFFDRRVVVQFSG